MNNIGNVANAGIHAAGTIAVTKIAADTMHKTIGGKKGMKRMSKKAHAGRVTKPKTYKKLGSKKMRLTKYY